MNIRVISIYMIAIFGVTVANLSTAYGQQEKTEPVISLVQTDPILGKQYHKQQYEIRDGKICPIDIYGNREYHKTCLALTTGAEPSGESKLTYKSQSWLLQKAGN